MDKEKIKLIIRNLESLVDCLKSEVYSDVELYKQNINYEEIVPYIEDYDEVFCDDEDDYDDLTFSNRKPNKKYKITNNDNGEGM